MIQAFVDFLKMFARPSSITFLIATVAFGVVLAFTKRTERVARWYLAALLLFYWCASAPMIVEPLIRRQEAGMRPLTSAADARGAKLIVVLGAGNATIQAGGGSLNAVSYAGALRLLEAARLYRLLDHPTVIVSGGITRKEAGWRSEADAMKTAIVELGVPADHVMLEAESKITRDEAIVVARMLADRPRQPIVLVTSGTHMPRAMAVFRAAGLDPVASIAPYKSDHSFERLRWVPSDGALLMFDTLVYDIAATWYYRMRGWQSP